MVATNIHVPVDSTLLGDGVRVLTRAIQRAKLLLQPASAIARTTFRNRTRSARQVMYHLITTSRQRGEDAAAHLKEEYHQLIQLTEQVVDQAKEVGQYVRDQASRQADRIRTTLDQYLPRVEQVITQTRRVRDGESVAADEKLVGLFAPQFGRCSGERRAYEQQCWFVRGRRWRTGIEGRMSVLKRRYKLDRCRYHGSDGMERWVGWGVIAHNLRQIAAA